ncbi:MAG TPA: hypothetical protein VKA15_05560 [Isosphaeraceae bacterium]|nr:hypothetical protein [Isosphaeraceae bacterium]
MNLISKLLQAARTWRHQSGGRKTAKRAAITVEQLDHRQLLSVNFTGNVAIDFPATKQPGVVLFNSSTTPNIQHPIIPATLQPLIPISGFDLSDIAVSYDPPTDTLSIGLSGGPANIPSDPTGPVIAGDADDNGNAGTVNPAVEAAAPGFTEFYALGGPEQMAASLFLSSSSMASKIPQVVAGFSPIAPSPTPTDPSPPKPYQVALAIPGMNPQGIPFFGTSLPQFTGTVYLFNSAAHPNLEFSITHFSQLYQLETGQTLTPGAHIGIGGFAGSPDDIGISDAFFPESTFTLAQATLPPGNPEPSPYILINPHEHRIIDTAHRDLVRVTIFGTSGFPVSQINPQTVELDGVPAIAHVNRKFRRDEFLNATYVFPAQGLNQPAGLYPATLTGQTDSGVPFASSKAVLNIPDSARLFGRLHRYMGGGSIYKAVVKAEARNASVAISQSSAPVTAVSRNPAARGAASIAVNYSPVVSSAARADRTAVRPVVSIPRLAAHEHNNVPTRLRHSLNDYLS